MPVIDRTENRRHPYLLKRLIAEWRGKGDPNDDDAPLILLEGGSTQRPHRVFVKWRAWEPLTSTERAEMILDAAERVLGLEASMDITPMGLTPEEAESMGIRFD